MGEVRFKIYEANPRQPTFMEVLRGKWPKDIEREVVISADEIEKIAILSMFGYQIPDHLNRAVVAQEIYNVRKELVCPKDGMHTPRVETFLIFVETIRRRQEEGDGK